MLSLTMLKRLAEGDVACGPFNGKLHIRAGVAVILQGGELIQVLIEVIRRRFTDQLIKQGDERRVLLGGWHRHGRVL